MSIYTRITIFRSLKSSRVSRDRSCKAVHQVIVFVMNIHDNYIVHESIDEFVRAKQSNGSGTGIGIVDQLQQNTLQMTKTGCTIIAVHPLL